MSKTSLCLNIVALMLLMSLIFMFFNDSLMTGFRKVAGKIQSGESNKYLGFLMPRWVMFAKPGINQTPTHAITTPDRTKPKCYMKMAPGGLLANQMWEYASTIGLARTYNYTPIFCAIDDCIWIWGGLKLTYNYTSPVCKSLANITKVKELPLGTGGMNLNFIANLTVAAHNCSRNISLHPFLLSYTYFWDSVTEILKEYTFKDDVNQRGLKTIEDYLKPHNLTWNQSDIVLIGIHNRRGDFIRWRRPRVDEAYLESAMDMFYNMFNNSANVDSTIRRNISTYISTDPRNFLAKQKLRFPGDTNIEIPNTKKNFQQEATDKSLIHPKVNFTYAFTKKRRPVFLLLGNDLKWNQDFVRQQTAKNKPYLILTPPTFDNSYIYGAYVDMCIFKNYVEHAIISYGTYSWWAGFLNGGIVVHRPGYDKTKYWLDDFREGYYWPSWLKM